MRTWSCSLTNFRTIIDLYNFLLFYVGSLKLVVLDMLVLIKEVVIFFVENFADFLRLRRIELIYFHRLVLFLKTWVLTLVSQHAQDVPEGRALLDPVFDRSLVPIVVLHFEVSLPRGEVSLNVDAVFRVL